MFTAPNAAALLAAGYTYRQSGLRQGGTCSCGGARGNTKSDARRAFVEKDARNLLRGLGIADPSDAQVKPIIDALIAQLDGENGAEPGTSGSPTANLLVVNTEDDGLKAMTATTPASMREELRARANQAPPPTTLRDLRPHSGPLQMGTNVAETMAAARGLTVADILGNCGRANFGVPSDVAVSNDPALHAMNAGATAREVRARLAKQRRGEF